MKSMFFQGILFQQGIINGIAYSKMADLILSKFQFSQKIIQKLRFSPM